MGLFSKHTQPIRATRGSLESLLDSASNDTTMVGNGSGYFEIQAWEVDFAQPKKSGFLVIFGPFWAKNNADMWDFSLSILNQSGPLGGRWKAYSVAYLMTPQYFCEPKKIAIFGHFGPF